jgi:hypothetical protein
MAVTIQLRGDTAANWTGANPVLHQRELGVETDTGKAKLGDGVTTWASLGYWQPGGSEVFSVNGHSGTVTLAASDVGADPAGAAAAAAASAEAASVPLSALPLALASGGTGATTASGARSALGLGSAATQPVSAFDASGSASGALSAAETFATNAVAAETSRAETAEGLAAQKSANLSDLGSASTARANLGLGSAATQPANAFDIAGAASSAQTAAMAASLPTLTSVSLSASGPLTANKINEVTATSGVAAMTLPTPVINELVVCERTAASTANVTIAGNIRDAANTTITLQLSSESEAFFSDGSTWWPIAGHKTLQSLDARYDAAGAAAAAAAASVPQSQSFALANNTYKDLLEWTVTGQTDTTQPFGLVAGSQTYQKSGYSAIQGPAFWFGYNPDHLSDSAATSSHGAVGLSCFGDAGDTNNGSGGHGLEMNPACFITPDGTKATNAFQMVATDDNTNTVSATIHCGTGNSNGSYSGISMQNADGSKTYMTMGPVTSDQVAIYQPIVFSGSSFSQSAASVAWSLSATAGVANFAVTSAGAGNSTTFALNSGSAGTSVILNGATAIAGQVTFQRSGTSKWVIQHNDPYLQINNSVNGVPHAYFIGGATYALASTWFLSKVQAYSSLIVSGGAALATTATDGFFYFPTCAGAPTGTPTAQAGSVPCVYDTTNDKLWIYRGGAWAGVAI